MVSIGYETKRLVMARSGKVSSLNCLGWIRDGIDWIGIVMVKRLMQQIPDAEDENGSVRLSSAEEK